MNFKKLSAGLAALFVILAGANVGISAFNTGDVNEDNTVNSADALLVLQNVVGIAELSESQTANADMNSDGRIDSTDAMLILMKVVGSGSSDSSETEVPEKDYSKYIGKYQAYFGEERTKSYTAYGTKNPNQKIQITSYVLNITGFQNGVPQGNITIEADGFSQSMNFSSMSSVTLDNDIIKITHKGSTITDFQAEIYLNENDITSKILKAQVLATVYDFPCTIYFEKIAE